jgi:predicted phage terminase large subunit-like protein
MVIHDVQRRRGSYGSIRPWMIQTMLADPVGTRNLIEETQAGQIIAADLLREPTLNSSTLGHVSPLKDKVTRAMPFAARVALGAVTLVDGPCTRDFLEELRAFGAGAAHDDMVDCAAYCWKAIADATLHKATEFDIL